MATIPGMTPYMAGNPYLAAVFQAMPSGLAAYSQDIGAQLFNFAGLSLPINTYPMWNPFGSIFTGGQTLPGFQGLGIQANFGAGFLQQGGGGQTAARDISAVSPGLTNFFA